MGCLRRALLSNTLNLSPKVTTFEGKTGPFAGKANKFANEAGLSLAKTTFRELIGRVKRLNQTTHFDENPLIKLHNLLYVVPVKEKFDKGYRHFLTVAKILNKNQDEVKSLIQISFEKFFFWDDYQKLLSPAPLPDSPVSVVRGICGDGIQSANKQRASLDEAIHEGSTDPIEIAKRRVFEIYKNSAREVATTEMAQAIDNITVAIENLGVKFRNKKGKEKNDIRELVKKGLEFVVVDLWGAKFLKDADVLTEKINAIYEGKPFVGVREDFKISIKIPVLEFA